MPTSTAVSRLLRQVMFVTVIGIVTPALAQSQGTAQDHSVKHRNDCRLAQQVLMHGRPANRREWAINYSNNCGALGGESLAAILPRYRNVSAPGGEMEDVVQSAAFLIDRRIFDAALLLAADEGGASVARVQAIRIVYHQLNPASYYDYPAFITDSRSPRVEKLPSIVSEAPLTGTPLGDDALERAAQMARGVITRASTSASVRQAGSFLLSDVEDALLRARLCGRGVSAAECDRRVDEWEAP